MLVSKHVDRLCCLGDGKRSMDLGRRGITVQFEEGPELLVGHSEVIPVFVKAPYDFCVEVR